ncbi:LamG-like jellyroll fold domain-containing protein [[Eubacterium] cellulosolvens]
MPKISTIIIILLLILTCINLSSEPDNLDLSLNINTPKIINNSREQQDALRNIGSRNGGSTPKIENNPHGGSRVDTFVDDSGIDKANSDNLNLNNNEVKIKKRIPEPFSVDSNTVGLWHFDEGSGGTVYDETSNNNDGTVYGATWTSGQFNDALRFDGGGSQRVDVPDDNSLDLTNVFTIEAWVFRERNSNRDMIVCKEHAYYFQIDYYDILALNIYSGSNNIFKSVTPIPLGRWVHVAAAADGSNVRIYINRCLDATYTQSASCRTNSNVLEIGRLNYQPLKWFFKGRIDEVRISNTSRSYFECMANLTSKPIIIPQNMQWNSIIINKTQPVNTAINVKILNASDNQQITGSPIYTGDGEFDISYIDPVKYPSIKLNATFRGKGLSKLILHYWGVSWCDRYAWRDTFFGGLKSTKQNLTSGDGECWLNTKPYNFTKYQSNPILSKGPGSTWDVNGVSSPSVLYNGTGYMMWFRGMTSTKWEIGLATSNDGISWTKYGGNPVLRLGPSGSWDDSYIGAPSVSYDGNIYKMWYQGEKTNFKIGYATSTDGINWQKYANNPVLDLGVGGSWEDIFVCGPFVNFDGLVYHMWYGGKKGATQIYKVGYASSYDGTNWTKYPNNPILQAPSGNLGGLCVVPERDYYLGWYNNGGGIINHATSRDGIYWVNYTNNPVITKSSAPWEDTSVQNPDVIIKDRQYWIYYTARGSNIQIGLARSNFSTKANIVSEVIMVPEKSEYDKLIINKSEPSGTFINISILDATTKNAITNYENIRNNIVDVSSIFRDAHPAVILKASISSSGINTPILRDWSIGWTGNKRPKIIDINSSKIVNRTHSVFINVNLSDLDELEQNLSLLVEYKAPSESEWDNAYLTTPTYITDRWVCTFNPPAEAELGFYAFKFRCNDSWQDFDIYQEFEFIRVVNNDPIIWNISTKPIDAIVNRTKNIGIYVNCSDVETAKSDLEIIFKYKSPWDQYWNYLYNEEYSDGLWEISFTPPAFAELGVYIFNITCNDSDSEVYEIINLKVLNNLPIPPDVSLSPPEPNTLDDITANVENAYDIETYKNKLSYWYRWYKDNFYMAEFENLTTIPHSATIKDQTWRCIVYVHDGDELGAASYNETIIRNSPPILVENFDYYEMYEDTNAVLENKLTTIFTDYDEDPLAFSVTGQENLTVEITQANGTIKINPPENWFGTEAIIFYANDSSPNQAEETVLVTVKPRNDLPRITHVGVHITSPNYDELEFNVDQDDWLNLTIQVEDIDGDVERGMIAYIQNLTERDNFYFDLAAHKIIFHPRNTDVGWHYVNITITDNNETPLEYISQHIRIRVLNINDPPTVQITAPVHAQEFQESDKITFTAVAEDIDLKVWESNEKLSLRWSITQPLLSELGIGERLENISLSPGEYNITVEVTDIGNLKAYDHVRIIVKSAPEDEPTGLTTNYLFLLFLIIIIIILIIVGVLLFVYNQKKKREKAAQAELAGHVLQPDAAYLPTAGAPSIAGIVKSPQLSQPQVIRGEPLATATIPSQQLLSAPTPPGTPGSQPPAQLPPFQPGPSVVRPEETPQEKLKLLEERLLHGEIDQELYESLKAKYELEARPYQPPPQLPPASISIQAPPPTTTITPTPVSAPTTPPPATAPTISPSPTVASIPVPAPTQTTPTVAQPQTTPQTQPQAQPQVQPQTQPQQSIPSQNQEAQNQLKAQKSKNNNQENAQ